MQGKRSTYPETGLLTVFPNDRITILGDRQERNMCPIKHGRLTSLVPALFLLMTLHGSDASCKEIGSPVQNEFVIQLPWKLNYEAAGEIIAQSKGWYDSIGVSVRLKPWTDSVDLMAQVVEGTAELSAASADMILMAHHRGASITALGALLQRSPLAVIAIDRALKTPGHLKGKRIGYLPGHEHFLRIILNGNGVPLSSVQFRLREQDYIAALQEGRLDAIVGFVSSEVEELSAHGLSPHFMPAYKYGYHCLTHVYFTSTRALARRESEIRDVLDVTMRGWRYAFSHPVETARLIVEKYSTQSSMHIELVGLRTLKYLAAPAGCLECIGTMTKHDWEKTNALLKKTGRIKSPAALDGLAQPDFLEDR